MRSIPSKLKGLTGLLGVLSLHSILGTTTLSAQEVYDFNQPNALVSIENIPGLQGTAYARPEAAISFDANNDGLDDLLMGPSNFIEEPELRLAIFLNQGGGQYIESAETVIDQVPLVGYLNHPALVEDFNNDGADDVFLVDQGLEVGLPPFPGKQPILLLSDGMGGLINASTSHLPPIVEFHHSAEAGDVDRDGDVDIFVGTLSETAAFLLINDGSGNFTLQTDSLPQQIVTEEANWGVGAVTLADINSDGRLDAVFGTYKNSPQMEIAVALQDASGTFIDSQRLVLGQSFFSGNGGIDLLLAADLDGDGDDDVIGKIDESVLDQDRDNTEGDIGLFALRNDDGQLVNVSSAWLGAEFASQIIPQTDIAGMYLEDINGDQYPDLLFAHANIRLNSLGEFLLINNGKGRFSPAANVEVDSNITLGPVWYTDTEGDGDLDIVGMSSDVNQVGDQYIQSGYELVVLEKTHLELETMPTYPIQFDANTNTLSSKLNAGNLGLVSLSFSMISSEQAVQIQAIESSVSEIAETTPRIGLFNQATGELYFPELVIDGEVHYVNALFTLTDPANLIFTLTSINEG